MRHLLTHPSAKDFDDYSFEFSFSLEDHSHIFDETFKLKYTPSSPLRTLNSTGVKDNFYSNYIEWISETLLAVCIQDTLYAYRYTERTVTKIRCLRDNNKDFINQTKFASVTKKEERKIDGETINQANYEFAYGLTDGLIRLRDLNKPNSEKGFFQVSNGDPVNSMCWKDNIIVAGHESGSIRFFDTRCGLFQETALHKKNICTLKFDLYGKYLACSSQDNSVSIWCVGDNIPRHILKDSKSTVKGIAWCGERRNHLYTGSTTPENKIRLYSINVEEEKMLKSEFYVDSGVSSLCYSKKSKSLISTHGIEDDFSESPLVLDSNNPNSIKSWNPYDFTSEGVIGAHSRRVLSSAFNEKSNILVTLSSDENMKFWQLL